MSEPAVDAFLYLLGEAFDGRGIEKSNESQALLIKPPAQHARHR
jgi:hypothetical protein